MKVFRAKVLDTTSNTGDPTRIPAVLRNGDQVDVIYTAPFNHSKPTGGGFTAYPVKDDIILVTTCDDDSDSVYYYLSTIVSMMPSTDTAVPNYPKGSNRLGSGNQLRASIGIKDDYESGLEFYHESTTKDENVANSKETVRDSKIKLYAGAGHLEFDRNLEMERIQLRTKSGESKLELRGTGNEVNPDSMEARTNGLFQVISMAGGINLTCHYNAGEMVLRNYGRPSAKPGVPSPNTAGDIWIESWANQVNLNAYGFHPESQPAIFVTANKNHQASVVGLRSGGDVEISANYGGIASIPPATGAPRSGKITLWAHGDIDIVSETGDINLKAARGKVNLQPISAPAFVPTLDHKLM